MFTKLGRIRKDAKRLRYTAEATGARKVSNAAKTIQTLLGDYQDSVEPYPSHRAGRRRARGRGGHITYGFLHLKEAHLASRCEEQLDVALKSLDKAVRKAL